VVPDERSALETEIARLQDENATLKKEPLARGLPVPLVSGPHHRTYGSVSGGSMDYAVCAGLGRRPSRMIQRRRLAVQW